MLLRQNYRDWQEAIRAIVTQLMAAFNDKRLVRGVDAKDDVVIDDATKGLVLKSPNGNYWRATISNTGTVTWTNLGVTKP